MTERIYYAVIRSHLVDDVTVVDEVHLMDVAELIAAARRVEAGDQAALADRVCNRAHIHDTSTMAQACDQLPGSS